MMRKLRHQSLNWPDQQKDKCHTQTALLSEAYSLRGLKVDNNRIT